MEPLLDHQTIVRYILKYYEGTLTEEEKEKLDEWISADEKNSQLFEELKDNNFLQQELRKIDKIDTEAAWNRIVHQTQAPAQVIPVYKKRRKIWWAIAASLFLILATGYLVFTNQPANTIAGTKQHNNLMNDIAPGTNKAILTLADGTQIVLDSARNGAISQQGNVTVIKLNDGQISYKSSSLSEPSSLIPHPSSLTYNTITTPRGGQYQLILADGSKVWLNAASSLRFPNVFAGTERKVELTGEGYFEIAHDTSKPFHVQVGEMDVAVLGTHFNVNAYADDGAIKTTLLQGSVRVHTGASEVIIKPGQQAQFQTSNFKLETTDDVNLEAVIAWKNGNFNFYRENLQSVMKKISRWYDVKVEYRGNVNRHFGGTISRNVNASQVFKMLEITGDIKIKVEGDKVIVLP